MTKRQSRGLLAIATTLPRVTATARDKRGLPEPALVEQWSAIVGKTLADQCAPQRLARGRGGTDGTLHLRVSGPLALELQHLEPQLLERINGFFGYRAVARLSLHQTAPAPPKPALKPRPKPTPQQAAALAERLATVDDPGLRDSLGRLGAAVLARARSDRAGSAGTQASDRTQKYEPGIPPQRRLL